MLITDVTIFFQRLADDSFQFRRDLWIQAYRQSRRTIENTVKDQARRVTAERQQPRCHFIKHHPEREQIRTGIQLFPANLLRRHVSDCSEGCSWTGQVLFCRKGRG